MGLSFILPLDLGTRDPEKIVVGILARTFYEKVFHLVDQVIAVILAHLEIRGELDGVGRARFLAEPAEDASGKIDAEKLGIPPAVCILSGLQRNTVHRAGSRAEVAGNTPLLAVRVTREDDAAPEPRWNLPSFLRVEYGHPLLEGMEKDVPQGT